ncbi:calcium-translocating P-type ATPase, PMCA-type [Candidatus Woesearchaeota archaeon]|nr:calcium-translocating P-type ATPase, PMCA-type [Candidatus Woesearchaeota archaeon]
MHSKTIKQALEELQTLDKGLSQSEAEARLKQYGLNEIKEGKKISPWEIFIGQFKSIVIWILIFATVISAVLGEYIDAVVIIVIVILIAVIGFFEEYKAAVIGFFEEYKAERSIEALKKLASLKATVIRDGQKQEIYAKHLVPGDIIVLETGNKVPADARLIEVFNLQTQEAALTGESQPVKKNADALPEKTAIADMKNTVFSGTIVVSGRAKAVVAATGMKTEIGKIATMIEEVKPEPTPLQKKMDELGKLLGKVVIAIAVVIFIVGMIFQDKPWLEMLEFSAAVAVAAIPEALAGVVTITLAIGTQRMLKKNALVRKLPSVETLGSTTVICTDKTGTLTANQMTVRKLFSNGKIIDVTGVGYDTKGNFLHKNKSVKVDEIELLLRIGTLNNNAELKEGSVIGDPTEGSLIVSAAKAGLAKEEFEAEYKRIDEIEFTSERKMMTTIHKHHGEKIAYVKGAPEVVLKLCNYIYSNGKVKKLTQKDKEEILEINKEFADEALRVLGFAYKTLVDTHPEKNLIFVGLQGMIDPAREEVKSAIEKCNRAGIKVIMITGDHEITARAVAKEIGMSGKVITGAQLDEMQNLEDVVEEVAVFARVNPEHKIKIVDALKKKGHVVAMTGDGVNDAPALKKADIGIAMGISGTDVSKEASAMILLDDNFASIVNAVEEGRGIYDNIRKYIGFLLSGNIGEVLVVFLGIIFGLPLVLTATQILLINLVTDGLPALALTTDPYEPNAMSRRPRRQKESMFNGLNPFLLYYPIAQVAASLSMFLYFYANNPANLLKAQTAAFLTIGMFELYQSLASRSTIYPAVKVGIFKNRLLILAFISSFAVMAASIFVPSVGKYLDMASLSIGQFLFIALFSSIGAIIIEISKYLNTKNNGAKS